MLAAGFAGTPGASTPNQLTLSHSSSAIPDAAGPAITLTSAAINDEADYTFKLTFANPTIVGPSSGKSDSVFGFINLDTDRTQRRASRAFLDAGAI